MALCACTPSRHTSDRAARRLPETGGPQPASTARWNHRRRLTARRALLLFSRPGALLLGLALLGGCGGGTSGGAPPRNPEGSLAVQVVWPASRNPLRPAARTFDCGGSGAVSVKLVVLGPGGDLVAEAGPLDCAAGRGRVGGVPVGSNLTVVVLAANEAGEVVVRGAASGVRVAQGASTMVAVAAETWEAPLAESPNGATRATATPVLRWRRAPGATGYEIQVGSEPGFSGTDASALEQQFSVASDGAGGAAQQSPAARALAEQEWFWRVRAIADDDRSAGPWSAPASVTIDLNAILRTQGDSFRLDEDAVGRFNVLANDSGFTTLDGAALEIVTPPPNAEVIIDNAGSPDDPSDDVITYQPNADFNGQDTFSYRIAAGQQQSNPATVMVEVTAVDDLPLAVDDALTLPEDAPATLIRVLDNDRVADGFSAAALTLVEAPARGTAFVTDNGTPADPSDDGLTYEPAPDFHGADRFRYRVSDVDGDTADAEVSVVVEPDTPLALSVTFPPANANLGGIDTITVSGRVWDTDDGTVEPGDVSFIDVNTGFAVQQRDNLALWNRLGVDVSGRSDPELSVTVESNSGDRATITQHVDNEPPLFSPVSVVLDAANSRALVADGKIGGLVAVDLATGTRTVLTGTRRGTGPAFLFPQSVALDATNGRALILDRGRRALIAVDLAAGTRTVISDAGTGSGPGFSLPRSVVLDARNDRTLVADSGLRALVGVALATGTRTILSGASIGTGPVFSSPRAVVLDAGNGRALVADAGLRAVIAVDLRTGARTVLSDATNGTGPVFFSPLAMALDVPNGRALVGDSGLDALLAVDLATGTRTVVSDAAIGTGPVLSIPHSLALDTANGRVLVVEGGRVPLLVAVDTLSGTRTVLSDGKTGTGPALSAPVCVALDRRNGRVLVVDSGLRALLAVDFASGTRTVISDAATGTGPPYVVPLSLFLDEANGRAMVLDGTLRALLAVDLATGARAVLSDASVGTGPTFSSPVDAALDAPNGRVLVADTGLRAVVAVDLETGARSVLSGATIGTGPAYLFPAAIVLDASNSRALVVDSLLDALLAVDLATGARLVLSDSSKGAGPAFVNPSSIALDVAGDRVLIGDSVRRALFAVDLKSGARTLLSDDSTANGPLFSSPTSIALDAANNRALVADADNGAVLVFNLAPGAPVDRVILAK